MASRDWKGVDLAAAAAVTPAAISRYLNGRLPGSDELYRLAQALETSMEYLYCGETTGLTSPAAPRVAEPHHAYRTAADSDPADLDQVIASLERNLQLLRSFRSSLPS